MTTIVKEKLDAQKLRGGYYTPKEITDFICKWAITKQTQRVLEPSCGDGSFVEAAIKRFLELGVPQNKLFGLLKGIELIKEEAEKSKKRAANYGLNSTTIINNDFFNYLSSANGDGHFDVVIGNPPFIRYQNFPEDHRDRAFKMMNDIGLSPNKLTNIWVPFLVLSANALNRNGKLGMVIPAELFQVKYAAETRIFLSKFFSRITIVSFKKLVFKDIQQEVVLLLCEKDTTSNSGIRVVEVSSLEELKNLKISVVQKSEVKTLEHDSEKWTKYFLNEDEIQLLRGIKSDKRIHRLGKIVDIDVGLVTGRNDFFMMSEETVKKWKLQPYTIKVVGKSNHLKGLNFGDKDFQTNSLDQQHTYMFLPPNKDFDDLPLACRRYIDYGEAEGFNGGYKTGIRKRWYITPSLWVPEVFALRQVGDFPKIVVNNTEAASTDTIHRGKLLGNHKPRIVALSFLNSLSFAFSEVIGRSYGGGVLTFEPTEIEEIPLPILLNSKINFAKMDTLIRNRRIEEVLDIIDEELLIKQLKFKKKEVLMLRGIWIKLSQRRQGRKKG